MFFDDAGDIVRLLVLGPLLYGWLILVLRVVGKRTLAQLDAFDLIVTVALGSTFASSLLSGTVSLVEGLTALAMLALLQLALAWAASKKARVRHVVTSRPRLLVQGGELRHDAMDDERVTEDMVLQAVRSSGTGGLEEVAALVLETNGKFSVITSSSLGSGSALVGVDGPRAVG